MLYLGTLLIASCTGLNICIASGCALVQLTCRAPTKNYGGILAGQKAGGSKWLGR